MTRDISCSIAVPGRGSRPSRYRFSWSQPDAPEDFDPPQQFRALVTDVPADISAETTRQALQLVTDAGVGLNTPCRFSELRAALKRTGHEFIKDAAE